MAWLKFLLLTIQAQRREPDDAARSSQGRGVCLVSQEQLR